MREEAESGKIYVRAYDAEGRALMYMTPGRENTLHERNNMRNLVFHLEKAIACTKRQSSQSNKGSSPPLEKINLLIDYGGFTMKKTPSMSASKYTLDILQKHYPERMKRAYLLNPPTVFRAFWALIRAFVDPVTKEKIVFCSGKAGQIKLLENVADHSKLEPRAYGTSVSLKEFNSDEYFALPFDYSFDEKF